MSKADLVRIQHALDAAKKTVSLVQNESRDNLDIDEKLALALARLLEILGEAANAVSADFRNQHPDVPWRKMISLRNRLIHAYFDIDLDVVWDTIKEDLPPVIAALEKIIPL